MQPARQDARHDVRATLEAYAQIAEFVKANQGWAPLVVFLLAFGESLAFISLVLPAWWR